MSITDFHPLGWKTEIRHLWKTVGNISGEADDDRRRRSKGKKGFMSGPARGRIRPGNCSVDRLFGDARFTEAVLKFLADTGVGTIKGGVVIRGVMVE